MKITEDALSIRGKDKKKREIQHKQFICSGRLGGGGGSCYPKKVFGRGPFFFLRFGTIVDDTQGSTFLVQRKLTVSNPSGHPPKVLASFELIAGCKSNMPILQRSRL